MDRAEKGLMERAQKLARKRGYQGGVEIVGGRLIVRRGPRPENGWVDWVQIILAPRLLVDWEHKCESWAEAVRLLELMPPV